MTVGTTVLGGPNKFAVLLNSFIRIASFIASQLYLSYDKCYCLRQLMVCDAINVFCEGTVTFVGTAFTAVRSRKRECTNRREVKLSEE